MIEQSFPLNCTISGIYIPFLASHGISPYPCIRNLSLNSVFAFSSQQDLHSVGILSCSKSETLKECEAHLTFLSFL